MRRILTLVSCAAAVLAVAFPAAANNRPTTGTRIGLYNPPPSSTFSADTPFYISLGWKCDLGARECMSKEIGRGDFDLYLDGVLQPSTADVDVAAGTIEKNYLTNYPEGLPAGTYEFRAVWTRAGELFRETSTTITFS